MDELTVKYDELLVEHDDLLEKYEDLKNELKDTESMYQSRIFELEEQVNDMLDKLASREREIYRLTNSYNGLKDMIKIAANII